MKKMLLFASLLLVLAAPVAMAGGVSVAWGTVCYTENPVSVTTFACNTNGSAGNRLMTCSFKLDAEMTDMIALEWEIRGQTDAAAVPDYWKLGATPDCRAGKATFNSNFTTVETDVCVDWTAGAGFNAPNYAWGAGAPTPLPPDQVTITLGVAIDATTPYDAVADQEYYAGQVSVLNSKAVGTGACTGCSTGMIFGLRYFSAVGLDATRMNFYEPFPGGNQCLKWNNPVHTCIAPVPARNTRWGLVKSLYRLSS